LRRYEASEFSLSLSLHPIDEIDPQHDGVDAVTLINVTSGRFVVLFAIPVVALWLDGRR